MVKKILLVDDDVYIRDLYAEVLKDENYDITIAADGEEALSLVEDDSFDLILLDIMLPKLDGIQVLAKIKEDPARKSIPVIMLTGTMMSTESKVEGLDLGADDYLLEPVSPPVLMAHARAAVVKAQKSHRMQ